MKIVIPFNKVYIKKNNKSNVIQVRDYQINKVKKEIIDIIDELKEFDISSTITNRETDYILNSFYDYYLSKEIIYDYVDTMIGHFGDIENDAIEYNCTFDLEFVLGELALYELLDSNLSVIPNETEDMINKIYSKFRR